MNQKVETDLLFWRVLIVIHFVDRAIRWQAAALVNLRLATDLLAAFDKSW